MVNKERVIHIEPCMARTHARCTNWVLLSSSCSAAAAAVLPQRAVEHALLNHIFGVLRVWLQVIHHVLDLCHKPGVVGTTPVAAAPQGNGAGVTQQAAENRNATFRGSTQERAKRYAGGCSAF